MKKIVVRVVGGIVALLVLAVLGLVVKFYVMSPVARAAPDMKAPTSPEAIARGRYLVENVAACIGCHSQVDEAKPGDPPVPGRIGAGRDFGEIPGAPFHPRAPNLTPDKETGIGSFTDGEIVRAMREGIAKDGHALFPQMPYQTYARTLSDDDALAIVAFLRTLPPIKNDPGKTEVKFPVSMFMRAAPKPLEASPPPAPAPSDKMARGKWLLEVCSCRDCHDTVNQRHEPLPGMSFAGGQKFPLPGGKGEVYAANITSDPATGLGAYTDEDLRRVFDEGKGKTGRYLYVMPWSYYSGLTNEDKDALVAAIRAIPPVSNPVMAGTVK